jgi:hypothetical protein
VRCWLCGIEPTCEIDTSALDSAFSTSTAGRWPASTDGHQHAEVPPTPGQLEQAGHEALMRLMREVA